MELGLAGVVVSLAMSCAACARRGVMMSLKPWLDLVVVMSHVMHSGKT